MESTPKTKPAIDLPFIGVGGGGEDNSFDSRSAHNSFKSPPIKRVIGCS